MATDEKSTDELLDVLAWTMLGEAANQGRDGMAAIAHVIKNRAESGRYSSDMMKVALQPKQFSTWNKGEGGNDPKGRYPKSSSAFKEARQIAAAVLSGSIPDATGGATHYWSPKGMKAMGYSETPYWAKGERTRWGELKIGDHVFLPRKPVPPKDIGIPQPATMSPDTQILRSAYAKETAGLPQDNPQQSLLDFMSRRAATISPVGLGATPEGLAGFQRTKIGQPEKGVGSASLSSGMLGSPIAPSIPSPTIGQARDVLPSSYDINGQRIAFDRTYDAGNRMGTPGFGSILDPRSTALASVPSLPRNPYKVASGQVQATEDKRGYKAGPMSVAAPGAGLSSEQRTAIASLGSPNAVQPSLAGMVPREELMRVTAEPMVPPVPADMPANIRLARGPDIPAPYLGQPLPPPTAAQLTYGQTKFPSQSGIGFPTSYADLQRTMGVGMVPPVPATMSPGLAASRMPTAPVPATMSAGLAQRRAMPSVPSMRAPVPATMSPGLREMAPYMNYITQQSPRTQQPSQQFYKAGNYVYAKGPNGYVKVGSAGSFQAPASSSPSTYSAPSTSSIYARTGGSDARDRLASSWGFD